MSACTFAPDRLLTYDIVGCCEIHDNDYTEAVMSRLDADLYFYW